MRGHIFKIYSSEVFCSPQAKHTKPSTQYLNKQLLEAIQKFVFDIIATAKSEASSHNRRNQNRNIDQELKLPKISEEHLKDEMKLFIEGIMGEAQMKASNKLNDTGNDNVNVVDHEVEITQVQAIGLAKQLRDAVEIFVSSIMDEAQTKASDSFVRLPCDFVDVILLKVDNHQLLQIRRSNESIRNMAHAFVNDILVTAEAQVLESAKPKKVKQKKSISFKWHLRIVRISLVYVYLVNVDDLFMSSGRQFGSFYYFNQTIGKKSLGTVAVV
ncbi:hypothetical protein SK128_009290 [Halocaridina rubra]|uniref:Uncharacterized protein n=1 Tax=Halocaridina rubra TaxID=373956 RepID=A0AAN8WDJ8_HALRR